MQNLKKAPVCRLNKVKGTTLSEMAMVLLIIGTVTIALFVTWQKVAFNNLVRTATQELAVISNNIRAAHAEQGGVIGNNTALTLAMDQMKVFPFEMRQNPGTAGSVIFNPWSRIVTGASAPFLGSAFVSDDTCAGTGSGASPQACFSITFRDLPQNACISLVEATAASGTGLQAVFVNTVLTGDANSAVTPLPVPSTTANLRCNLTTSTNRIMWVYLLRDNKS